MTTDQPPVMLTSSGPVETEVLGQMIVDEARATMEGHPAWTIRKRLATAFAAADLPVAQYFLEAVARSISRGEISDEEAGRAATARQSAAIDPHDADSTILLGSLPELRHMRDEAEDEMAAIPSSDADGNVASHSGAEQYPDLAEAAPLSGANTTPGPRATPTALKRVRRQAGEARHRAHLHAYIARLDEVEQDTREELQRRRVLPPDLALPAGLEDAPTAG